VGVWGLAFKPKTDDLRQAPSVSLIEELLAEGAIVTAHDPVAMDAWKKQHGARATLVENPYAVLDGAEALFLVTEWNEFRTPDFERMKQAMAQPVLFDGRNVWNPARMREYGFTYYGIGR
ncbi:MAG: UDP-glucose 6-dehydrogenase, partial [Deltaproteobacteria bacterium]|nr:UDP-glucose 6-dehydrogenase [Deltaproteobacteria bacterium]